MRISQWPSCQPAGSEHTKRPRKQILSILTMPLYILVYCWFRITSKHSRISISKSKSGRFVISYCLKNAYKTCHILEMGQLWDAGSLKDG